MKIPIELQEPFQRKVSNPDPNPNNYIENMNLHYFSQYFLLSCLLVISTNAETKHTEYYDKLGVSPTADGRAIKKGFFFKHKLWSIIYGQFGNFRVQNLAVYF